MLYDFDHGGILSTHIPPSYNRRFRAWKSNMRPADIARVKRELHQIISTANVHTTSWIPGEDWFGKPWFPIFLHGARQNEVHAAMCFGLFCWECFLERSKPGGDWGGEDWGYKHCDDQWGNPIKGRTYFRLNVRPSLQAPIGRQHWIRRRAA
jgi:hypothetical protein